MKEDMSELKKRALAIVDIYSDLNRITEREANILREAITMKRPQGEIVIKCKDCKYQVKEWREDKRMKEKGYWVCGCEHFGEIMGYWGFGGNDNEFCSNAIEERSNGYGKLQGRKG